MFLCQGAPEGPIGSGSGLKHLRSILVNVKAPMVATTNWLWLISALVMA